MHRFLLLAVAAFAVPSLSHAQLQIGGRVGFAKAMGNALEDADTGERIEMKRSSLTSQVPLQLDVGVQVSPELSVGCYFGYGVGQMDSSFLEVDGLRACGVKGPGGKVECTGSAWRVGVQGAYTFTSPGTSFVPWVGLSLGRESTIGELKGPGVSAEVKLTGYEVGVQLGGDYRVSDVFAVGPFVSLGAGRYGEGEVKTSVNGRFQSVSASIDEKTWHQWFGVGLRGQFTL